MHFIYNILISIATFFLWCTQFFSKKMKLFVEGRKDVFEKLNREISENDKTIWFHCASLGEFEQGVPIMERVKKMFPKQKLLVTFFSPSGYEIKKNTKLADVTAYLPLDTKANAEKFIQIVNPSLVIFVKYEIWPNYLFTLQKRSIPTLLVSGLFRENQLFFKGYGTFMRKALQTFNHIFVQDNASEALLNDIKILNVTVSGDTRFDRVSHQIEQDNTLDFIESFKGESLCVVCGSTWPEDEAVLEKYINEAPKNVKFIIAPHKIDTSKIESFRKNFQKESILFSEIQKTKILEELSAYNILIIDTIGILTKIYSYADVAYVGGAIGNTGLHNILEPATFGVPIVIGNNFDKFPEAKKLQRLAGLFSVQNASEASEILAKLIDDKNFRNKTGMINGHFINSNTGATKIVMDYIETLNRDGLV